MSDPWPILVLQHVSCEPPGTYTGFLAKRAELVTVQLDEVGAGPLEQFDLHHLAGVVAMGGPMGVYETVAHPWIEDELAFIAAAVAEGVPFLGVCLGAQMLAGALGGEVFVGDRPEVGIHRVSLTSAAAGDPVLGDLPLSFVTLQWHGDTFTLPEGATRLASSPAYPNQAFAVGSAYRLQFHCEADWDLASQWLAITAYRRSIEATLGPDGPERLAREHQAASTEITAIADRIIEGWLTTYVDPRLP